MTTKPVFAMSLYSASGAFKFILENYKPLEKPFCTSKPPLELVAFSHYILTQAGCFAHMESKFILVIS